MRVLKTPLNSIEKLRFSADGNALFASYETVNYGWRDWQNGPLSPEIITDFRYSSAAWAPDNSGVFLAVSRGIRFVDLVKNEVVKCGIPTTCSGWFHVSTTGPSYAIVTHGLDRFTRFDYDTEKKKFVKRWSVARGKVFSHYAFGHIFDQHNCITTIEVGKKRGEEIFWVTTRSTIDGSEIHRVPIESEAIRQWTDFVTEATFQPNAQRAAVGYGDHLAVLNLRETDPARLITRMFETLDCHEAAYHPNGQTIFLKSFSTPVIGEYILATGKQLAVFEGNEKNKLKYLSALTVSPDGHYLAAATRGKVVVWETTEGHKV